MVTLPFRFVYSLGSELLQFLIAIIWGARPPPASPDPVGDVRHFSEQFSSTYGHTGPDLTHVSYATAAQQAKEELRFLLVYLHNWDLAETEQYCREVICSEEFVAVIREKNILYWAVDVQSAEGKRGGCALCLGWTAAA
jgi:FAS-associated factor 2